MKNVYTPAEIERILEATLGPSTPPADAGELRVWSRRRADFISLVGRQAAAEVLAMRGDTDSPVLVFAGDDICGAYALATAIELHQFGCRARVCLFNIGGDMLSIDTRLRRDELRAQGYGDWLDEVVNPGPNFMMPEMGPSTIVVDGLFGTDYQKPLRGGYQAVARHINEAAPRVISIDIPSGMTLDLSVGMINRNIIHADLTLAIVGPTLAFFMPENAQLIGRWKTLKLPLDKSVVKRPSCRIVDSKAIRTALPVRDPMADKNELGSALIFAGSYGMLGAAVLATRRKPLGLRQSDLPRPTLRILRDADIGAIGHV